ncbi:MAG: hypothetical protein H0U86_12250 [Chloroflexi bacterium]|nr:hypothetical protein [Chloroflexota bacterium]
MGEEPLAETRLAIDRQRTELERTSDQLRDALDLKKRFRENPALVVGLGAGALFLVAGGPVRVAKVLRRRIFRSEPEKAYDALPKPMQSWVDHMAGAVGPRAAEARQTLSEELVRWRHNPKKHGKINKKLAKQIAEGPPGPGRAAWTAFEAGAAIVTAALARKVVERFLSGEPPSGIAPLDAAGTVGGAAQPDARHAKDDVTRSSGERAQAAAAEDYSGMSSRRDRVG